MHQSILAQRKATATQRIITQASALAAHLDLDPKLAEALQPKGIKDPQVADMLRLEALADLLDRFAADASVTEPVSMETAEETKQMDGAVGFPENIWSLPLVEPEAPAAVQEAADAVEDLEKPAPVKKTRKTSTSKKKK